MVLKHLGKDNYCVNPDCFQLMTKKQAAAYDREQEIIRQATVRLNDSSSIEILPERIRKKIAFGPKCWIWLGAISKYGYGYVKFGKYMQAAHRVVYTLLVSDIPVGMTIDHMCKNKACVNPDCLQLMSKKEMRIQGGKESGKAQGARQRAKTHCPQGHPYSGDNLYVWRGHRICRICKVIRQQRSREHKEIEVVEHKEIEIDINRHYTKSEWKNLKSQYSYTCLACGRQEPEIELAADHIIPQSKGGSSNINNIQPLCQTCNNVKGVNTISYLNSSIATVAKSIAESSIVITKRR